ncbi:MAG: bifunctional folylpolyglutamate synthase/dihydrofolate synthase, partial [Pedobacter sp.]
GYKTGLYTSPHLKDFRERIRINGEMIPEQTVVDFVQKRTVLIDSVDPSFFEVTVAMAFDYFAAEKIDVAVVEVGLGGRLDSTNIIDPDLSVITNISLDHTNILGDTLRAIASEKAGIIKNRTPVIVGEYDRETAKVFESKAKECNAPLLFADNELKISSAESAGNFLSVDVQKNEKSLLKDLLLDLTGIYQQKNIITVLSTVQQLKSLDYNIKEDHVRSALMNVKSLTGLMGRWQTIGFEPLIICDTGHNEAGITEVLKNIAITPFQKLHIVIGMVKDKDISKVLSLIGSTDFAAKAAFYFTEPALPRALPAAELAQKADQFGLKGSIHSNVRSALSAAKRSAGKQDLIFVGGSTFVVAEAL